MNVYATRTDPDPTSSRSVVRSRFHHPFCSQPVDFTLFTPFPFPSANSCSFVSIRGLFSSSLKNETRKSLQSRKFPENPRLRSENFNAPSQVQRRPSIQWF